MADQPKVAFHWVKSNHFRVIRADGAYGGLTPYQEIFFSLYNDRTPIPEVTVQPVTEEGILGPEITEEKKVKTGIEREVEACVLMNVNTARALRDWLSDKIKVIESLNAQEHQQEREVKQ